MLALAGVITCKYDPINSLAGDNTKKGIKLRLTTLYLILTTLFLIHTTLPTPTRNSAKTILQLILKIDRVLSDPL